MLFQVSRGKLSGDTSPSLENMCSKITLENLNQLMKEL